MAKVQFPDTWEKAVAFFEYLHHKKDKERPQITVTYEDIAKALGCSTHSLKNWRNYVEKKGGNVPGRNNRQILVDLATRWATGNPDVAPPQAVPAAPPAPPAPAAAAAPPAHPAPAAAAAPPAPPAPAAAAAPPAPPAPAAAAAQLAPPRIAIYSFTRNETLAGLSGFLLGLPPNVQIVMFTEVYPQTRAALNAMNLQVPLQWQFFFCQRSTSRGHGANAIGFRNALNLNWNQLPDVPYSIPHSVHTYYAVKVHDGSNCYYCVHVASGPTKNRLDQIKATVNVMRVDAGAFPRVVIAGDMNINHIQVRQHANWQLYCANVQPYIFLRAGTNAGNVFTGEYGLFTKGANYAQSATIPNNMPPINAGHHSSTGLFH